MSRPSLVIVLAEDDRHKSFTYRFLIKCGLENHQIRIQLSPSGRGSAESWVREKFVQETIAYRSRQARAHTALIVLIDADTSTVQHRLNQLDQSLRDGKHQIVGGTERIARLVPKRNVETWILCLNGQDVDEQTDYKNTRDSDNWNELIPQAAETLYQSTPLNTDLPNHFVGSLRAGIRELKRLKS